MKSVNEWFQLYGQTHRHPLNQQIHKICVPAIYWSAVALLWALPRPAFMAHTTGLNWATILLVGALFFYLRLGFNYFIEMFLFSLVCLGLTMFIEIRNWPLAWIGGGVFVIAWIGQFYGHKVEGKKPAFLEDLAFLLIGPLWIFNSLKPSLIKASDKKDGPRV